MKTRSTSRLARLRRALRDCRAASKWYEFTKAHWSEGHEIRREALAGLGAAMQAVLDIRAEKWL